MSNAVERAKNLHQKIRNLLMQEWDPIGVRTIPEAQDEYDSYIPTIYSLLISRKPINEVYEYLVWLEKEHMGLAVDRQRTLNVAKTLVDLE